MSEPRLLTQRDRKAIYRAGWDSLDDAGLQLVLERYEATVADLERQLAAAQGQIAALKGLLGLDSGAGLGNEFHAWEAASDEALSMFEEGLDEPYVPIPSKKARQAKGRIVGIEHPSPSDTSFEK